MVDEGDGAGASYSYSSLRAFPLVRAPPGAPTSIPMRF